MLAKTKPARIRVLIIDDSRLVRIASSRMFDDTFEVILAVDGADGWEIIQRDTDIQVVFTDLVMPEMDGFELLEAVRTHDSDMINSLPIIVATGADNPEIAKQKAFALGATDFITKPFDATQMKARARSYAQFHGANKQLQQQTTLDGLTGLLNTKGLHRQLGKEISFVARHQANITVMSVQIDNFKDLFIQIGRAGAEIVIKRICKVLGNAVRKEDTIARKGVANFVVTMPLTEAENAMELADRICQKIESFKAKRAGERLSITVSIGVSTSNPDKDTAVAALLSVADEALQRATALGRSQLFMMTLDEYHNDLQEKNSSEVSLDYLLEKIDLGQQADVIPYLDNAINQISPLVALLSEEQKQRLLTMMLE